MKINVLGTEYEIIFEKDGKVSKMREEFDHDYDGCCDFTTKKIYIADMSNDYAQEDVNQHQNRTIRHELVHAFLYESGLDHNSEWARNEEVVDWVALQAPKLFKAFEKVTEKSNLGNEWQSSLTVDGSNRFKSSERGYNINRCPAYVGGY